MRQVGSRLDDVGVGRAKDTDWAIRVAPAAPARRGSRPGRPYNQPRRGRARDQSPRPSQVLRRSGGGSGDRPRGRRSRDLRLPGAERGREDDHGRDPRGLPRAQRRRGLGARRRPRERRVAVAPADRDRAPGVQHAARAHGARVARALRRLLRVAAIGRRDDRAGRARERRRSAGRPPVRRPAAPARRGSGAGRRPGAPVPRRAHDRLRSLGPAPGVGGDSPACESSARRSS